MMPDIAGWKTKLCSGSITPGSIVGAPCVVVGSTISFHESDEARVRDALERQGLSFVRDAEINFAAPRQVSTRPVYEVETSQPVDTVIVDAYPPGATFYPPTPVQTSSVIPRVPSVMPPAAEAIEEQIQKTSAIARSVRASLVDELCGLVRLNASHLVTSVRDRVLSSSSRLRTSEEAFVKAMAYGQAAKVLKQFASTEYLDRAKEMLSPVFDAARESGLVSEAELSPMLEKAIAQVAPLVPKGKEESLGEILGMLVAAKMESESAMMGIKSLRTVSDVLRGKIKIEVEKLSSFPFVEEMWCERSSLLVKVKDANIIDQATHKTYFLGRYIMRISMKDNDYSIFSFDHCSTPKADYLHPHVMGRGQTVCFGSQTVYEGLLRMLGEMEFSTTVQVLYSFLNMYNVNSKYNTPDQLLEHWKAVGWNDKHEREANGLH